MKKHFVAFIDILGYSSMVNQDCWDASRSFANQQKLEEVIQDLSRLIDSRSIDITQFSDCIVLTMPYDPGELKTFLEHCCILQRNLIDNRILCRGGVSYGDHYKSKDFLFSEGLITAYNIESKIAKYPRIIISEDLLELFEFVNENSASKQDNIDDIILLERTGEFFIDYLKEIDFNEAKEIGEYYCNQLKTKIDLSTKEKLFWILDYIDQKHPGCVDYTKDRFLSL